MVRPIQTGNRLVDTLSRETADKLAQLDKKVPKEIAGDSDGVATISAEETSWKGASSRIRSILAETTTSDATAATLLAYTLGDNLTARFTGTVTAFRQQTGDSYGIDFVVQYRRTGGAAPSIVGSYHASAADNTAGAASWSVAVDASGNDVRVRVTGQASATVQWTCELRAQER